MNWKKLVDDSASEIRAAMPPENFRDPVLYAWWLSQTYHFVKHSTSLLGFALPHLHDEKIRGIFEHHLGEESRHDLLALKDIERMNRSISPVTPMTEAFYQAQYYRIQFEGGKALLGYILFLENLAVTWGKDIYSELLPLYPKSLLFLKVHAEEDESHVSRAMELIQSLSDDDQEVIRRSFEASVVLYSGMLKKVNSLTQRKVA